MTETGDRASGGLGSATVPGLAHVPAARPMAAMPGPSPSRGASLIALTWTLMRTDFKARYHGTLSGFVWALLKPLAMFAVLVAVFSLVFSANPNYKLHLIIGLFLWDFFAEGTKTGLAALHAKGFLLTKARFPSSILVVASLSNALITLAVFAIAIVAFLGMTGRGPSITGAGLFLMYVAGLIAIVVGFSLMSSVLFLRYRDLNQVWDVAMQAGFFIAPIIYPLGVIPERYHFFLHAWPPTPIIEFSRAVLVDGHIPTLRAHLYLAGMVLAIVAAGGLIFRRFAPRAAEYV